MRAIDSRPVATPRTASSISIARCLDSASACAGVQTPAAAYADSSPTLYPATHTGWLASRADSAAQAASVVPTMRGCAMRLLIAQSRSATRMRQSEPSASASAASSASHSRVRSSHGSIPACWLPCPANSSA